MAQPQVEIRCCIMGETQAAYRITTDGTNSFWIPKSQILDDDLPEADYMGMGEIFSLFIPVWLAIKSGLV